LIWINGPALSGTMMMDGILSLSREHPAQASAPSMRLLRSAPILLDEGEAALSGARATIHPREMISCDRLCRVALSFVFQENSNG
jgi:hypothetical protein